VTPKILWSPCDPTRQAHSEIAIYNWKSYSAREGRPIPCQAISYVICKGGDVMRPTSVLATTRNLSTDDLATATWVGADQVDGKKKPHPNIMANLETSQGQIVMADGSTKLAKDSDLQKNGMVVKPHIESSGGKYIGPGITQVIQCHNGMALTQLAANSLGAKLQIAKKEKRLVYLLFTGSDWQPSCINLEQQVLKTQRWNDAINNLLKHICDFPITRQLSSEEKLENQRLAKAYGVSAYPTQMLLDGDGKVVRRTEGFNGNGLAYIKWVLGQ